MGTEERAPSWGTLAPGSSAPERGEQFDLLATLGGTTIEQIRSGRIAGPEDHLQGHDEWVVVLEGSADLEVAGELRTLRARDWVLLPAGTPHRVVSTEPGTSWLAVHVRADPG